MLWVVNRISVTLNGLPAALFRYFVMNDIVVMSLQEKHTHQTTETTNPRRIQDSVLAADTRITTKLLFQEMTLLLFRGYWIMRSIDIILSFLNFVLLTAEYFKDLLLSILGGLLLKKMIT